MADTDDAVILPAPGTHTATVIWLHGLGADGNDFVPIVPHLGLAADHGIKFIFPHAPMRPVTLNMGMTMRAWYDIKELSVEGREDAEGVAQSAQRVEGLIADERDAGIDTRKIVIAGFSQGGAVALHTALGYPARLGGLIALSTYLPLRKQFAEHKHAANADLPIFMAHGTLDPVVVPEFGTTSRDALIEHGYAVNWQDYPMQHQVCMEEIEAIGQALKAWLG
ncbi:alpha/beta fold hydrolase [bacterium]|nr:alpha/beta fold hydrolase [bacterium]